MNPHRPARLNRTVLAVLGLLGLAAGGIMLLLGTGILEGLLHVPADAPMLRSEPPLPGWAPWAGAGIAIIIGLLALRWLIAQMIRGPGSSDWQLAPDPGAGTTHINSDVAAQPLGAEIEEYPGVRSATARLTGSHQHPYLHLRVSADDHVDISDLRHHLDNDTIPRLAQAIDLPGLPADMLLRLVNGGGTRIR